MKLLDRVTPKRVCQRDGHDVEEIPAGPKEDDLPGWVTWYSICRRCHRILSGAPRWYPPYSIVHEPSGEDPL